MLWEVLLLACCCYCLHPWISVAEAANATVTCSFPAVYGFGDSMIDVVNSIQAFPNQFAYAELPPNGAMWPMHSADRMCDGKLLVDFIAFGGTLGPTYPWLRSTATNPEFGTNFASAGATAVNQTDVWLPDSGFSTPFSLNVQLQWLKRCKVRLEYYYSQTYVNQSLPEYSTLNTSMYMVQAGFQDYFPLYYKKSMTRMMLSSVPTVVKAISDFLKIKTRTISERFQECDLYVAPGSLANFGATQVLVMNVPPLGCSPALLTLYPNSLDEYNSYGCLTNLNKISIAHNEALEEEVILLRAKYPNVTYYLADFYSVYTDILAAPQVYNITQTLKACRGTGGFYNFNKDVACSEVAKIGNQEVNLTVATCSNTKAYLNWDGIHPSHATNRAAAVDFKHITPSGFGCVANTTQF